MFHCSSLDTQNRSAYFPSTRRLQENDCLGEMSCREQTLNRGHQTHLSQNLIQRIYHSQKRSRAAVPVVPSLPGAEGDGGHVPGQAHLQTPAPPRPHGAAHRQGRCHLLPLLDGGAGAYGRRRRRRRRRNVSGVIIGGWIISFV